VTSSDGRTPQSPTPAVHETASGVLRVVDSRQLGDREFIVDSDDAPLFYLLLDVLGETRLPDLLPAHLATACDDLVDARSTIADVHRGHVDLPGASYGMSYCYRARDAIDEWRDRDPLTLVVVGCSGSKHDVNEAVPAADLYRGAYWTCKQRYAEAIGDSWQILSAKHGLLAPSESIGPYERTPDDLQGVPADDERRVPTGVSVDTLLDRWAADVYEALTTWIQREAGSVDPRDVRLEVLLGRSYRDPLESRGVFDRLRGPADVSVAFPFQEVEQAQGGNGNQMGWMTDAVEAAVVTNGGEEHEHTTPQSEDGDRS
jgi:hypothetical protein